MSANAYQQRLKHRLTQGEIRPIDFAFAEFICQQYSQESSILGEMAAYLSAQSGLQHVCVSIEDMHRNFVDAFATLNELKAFAHRSAAIACLPDNTHRVEGVQNHPIVYQGNAFYLQRYWVYETNLIQSLSWLTKDRSFQQSQAIQPILAELFPDVLHAGSQNNDELDWQKIAVAVAALNPVAFITGGPGTGKTTTVVKLIALMRALKKQQSERDMMIKLAAPTGKAAARLSESISATAQYLPTHLSKGLDIRCTTLHRLLGTHYQSIHFEHHQQNPIHADLIVLDEASMIDLPMMSKFFAAVPEGCKVVLLGDSEQLASVEVGTVLNDICALSQRIKPSSAFIEHLSQITYYDTARLTMGFGKSLNQGHDGSGLVNGITRLHKSHRFDANSGIGRLAQAIKTKDSRSAMALLNSSNTTNLQWFKNDEPEYLVKDVIPMLTEYCQKVISGELKQAFGVLKKQQVLCSHKLGRWGVDNINRRFEFELAKRSLLTLDTGAYPGKPIMIARNSPAQDLFNGDIGIIAYDPHNESLLKAWFETSDGGLRGILLNQLPEHDTVFAMTVHKSQGSEFDKVVLCLPHEKGRQSHLTRSLLYTGLTRSKVELTLFASEEAVKTAISAEVKRGSGLADRLFIDCQNTPL